MCCRIKMIRVVLFGVAFAFALCDGKSIEGYETSYIVEREGQAG